MDRKAADIILGSKVAGERFKIKWMGITLKLCIRPLTTEQLIRVSKEISQIGDISENDETMFQALMNHVSEAIHISRAIAIATGTMFPGIVSKAILKLPPEDIKTLFNIVRSNSDPSAFFFTIGSARKLSILKTKKEQ